MSYWIIYRPAFWLKYLETRGTMTNVIPMTRGARLVQNLTGEVEWYTPRQYIDAAIAVMGGLDLDPASSAAAQMRVRAGKYFSIKDNGLEQKWHGRVFLNPPYAMPTVKQFMQKMVMSYVNGDIDQGIMLVNNATDTLWFHLGLEVCTAICFTRGRIKFHELSGTQQRQPTHGQAFFYFGRRHVRFAKVFREYGAILHLTPSTKYVKNERQGVLL